jgi:hypothetical protein
MSIEEKAKQRVLEGTKEEIDKRLGKEQSIPIAKEPPQASTDKISSADKNNYEGEIKTLKRQLESSKTKINEREAILKEISMNNLNLLAKIDKSSTDQYLRDKAFNVIQDRCQSFTQTDDCMGGTVIMIKSNNGAGGEVKFCCKFESFLDPIIGLNNDALLDIDQ